MDDLNIQAGALWRPAQNGSRIAMSNRDRRIIKRALQKVSTARINFSEALRALREAVEEEIPDGRIFLLGSNLHGPILGSIISGLGIVDDPAGVQLVRTRPTGEPSVLGEFRP